MVGKYIIFIEVVLLLLLSMACTGKRYLCILEEDKDYIQYLDGLARIEKCYTNYPVGDNDFCLQFQTYNKSQTDNFDTSNSYLMHVVPQGDSYCIKILLTSSTFYENGKNIGHAEPSGQWSDCKEGEGFRDVLNYYLKNKSKIKIRP